MDLRQLDRINATLSVILTVIVIFSTMILILLNWKMLKSVSKKDNNNPLQK